MALPAQLVTIFDHRDKIIISLAVQSVGVGKVTGGIVILRS